MVAHLAVLLVGLVLTGCAPLPLEEPPVSTNDPYDLDKHIVVLDGRGDARDPDQQFIQSLEPNGELCERQAGMDDPAIQLRERFICIIRNMLARYRAWTTGANPRLKPGSVLKLLVYFNGGLNSSEDAIRTAFETYRQAEADEIYPIYMVWPTGAPGSYGEDVLKVRAGRWTPRTLPTLATVPVRPVSDLLRGLASTPAAWATSYYEFHRTSFGFGNEAYSMARDNRLLVRRKETIEPGRNLYFNYDDDLDTGVLDVDRVNRDPRPGASAARAASYLYYGLTAPIRVLSTPFMIGFGEAGWSNMVRRTRTSVRAVREFPPELQPAEHVSSIPDCMERDLDRNAEILQRCYPRGSGGFARFFQWIESCTTGEPIAKGADPCPLPLPEQAEAREILSDKLRITMIGHSMGAIVINELLQANRYPNLPYEALVYMGGAASVQETAEAVVPVLRDNRGCTKFYGLMLHPLNESREPTGFGLLVSGSLLTYVDEFLETPKTLPDRTVGQWHNLRLTRHLFPDDMQRWMLLRVYDRERTSANHRNPTTHGEFNDQNMKFWRDDFYKPSDVNFRHPEETSCENLFQRRLEAARTKAQHTGIPSDRQPDTRLQEQ